MPPRTNRPTLRMLTWHPAFSADTYRQSSSWQPLLKSNLKNMEQLQRLSTRALSADRREALLTTGASALVISFLAWCVRDYRAYLALGPGGPPYNVLGWGVITFGVRPFALGKASVFDTRDYPPTGAHADVDALPPRRGARAQVGGVAPHRQLSQHPPEPLRAKIRSLFASAAARNPDVVEMKLSLYERHNHALFVKSALLEDADARKTLPQTPIISRGEIGHPHPDLSIHLYLSPADARVLIEKGWAERHRLSVPRTSIFAGRYHVADTFLMVYGPRDEGEMAVLQTILLNSIRFMTGKEDIQTPEWDYTPPPPADS